MFLRFKLRKIRRRLEETVGFKFRIILVPFELEVLAAVLFGAGITPSIILSKLAKFFTEDELAAIFCHELAHIKNNESNIISNMLQEALRDALSDLDENDYPFIHPDKFDEIGFLSSELVQISHNNEILADETAIELLSASGYNPVSILTALQKIMELTGDREASTGHPSLQVRMNILKKKLIARMADITAA